MSRLTKLTLTEAKLFWRDPTGWFFALAFPPLLLVILGSVPAFREPDAELGGLRVIDLYVPILVGARAGHAGHQRAPQLPGHLSGEGHPAPAVGHPGAAVQAAPGPAGHGAGDGAGRGDPGDRPRRRRRLTPPCPSRSLGFLVAFVLAAAALYAVGLLVAAVAPSGKAAAGIGTVLWFPLMFFAGLWVPREAMPDVREPHRRLHPARGRRAGDAGCLERGLAGSAAPGGDGGVRDRR